MTKEATSPSKVKTASKKSRDKKTLTEQITKWSLGDETTQAAIETFDRLDEEQALSEIAGRVNRAIAYEFTGLDGNVVTALSAAGVDRACREYAVKGGIIRISPPSIFADTVRPTYVTASLVANLYGTKEGGIEVALNSTFGVARQCVLDKDGHHDPRFLEKLSVKLIRNAKALLLPEDAVKELIAAALGSGAAKKIRQSKKLKKEQLPEELSPGAIPKAASPEEKKPKEGDPSGTSPSKKKADDGLGKKRQTLRAAMIATGLSADNAKQAFSDISGLASSKDATNEQLDKMLKHVTDVKNGKIVFTQEGGKWNLKVAPPPEVSPDSDEEMF